MLESDVKNVASYESVEAINDSPSERRDKFTNDLCN